MNRDWGAKEKALQDFWAHRKREVPLATVFRLLDDLREQARRLRPDRPSQEERQEDLATHIRVSEALRSVPLDGGGSAPC